MKNYVNLLPISSQRQFEHWRQGTLWLVVSLATVLVLAGAQAVLEFQHATLQRQVFAEQASIAPLIQAQNEIQKRESLLQLNRRNLDYCKALEQTDVPLALLQFVGDCCSALGSTVQLESLRIDESSGITAPGKTPTPRKTLLLVGTADGDARVTELVGQLRNGHVFSRVDLEASQAVSDQQASQRTFRISCQQ